MDRVTTTEALEILRGKGFKVSYPTVARWAQNGAFKGAERDDTNPRGPIWLIPRESVLSFEPPPIGRPAKQATVAPQSTSEIRRADKTAQKLNETFRKATEAEQRAGKKKGKK